MKKVLIVNNNMKIGGVQKSLCNLLWSAADRYDITLLLFAPVGAYMCDIPEQVHVLTCDSLFRYLGMSQKECAGDLRAYLTRGVLAAACRLRGRKAVMPQLLRSQKPLESQYDCAISYLQNGDRHRFYGGVNEFVLEKVHAARKIAFLHCDYLQCGANCEENNALYRAFDRIAACSDGCRRAFLQAMPELAERCVAAPNFHRYGKIRELSQQTPYCYPAGALHVVMVGRLAHEKGIDRALRALACVRGQGIAAILHLVGSGPKEQELRALAQSLSLTDAVIFHGSQSNPYRFMRNADLLLMTSFHEAAPMVIDEACALSLPVLTVKTTSSDELVSARGCGWVCENEQAALNTALTALLKAPERIQAVRARLSQANFGNERAEAAFAALIGR